MRGVPFPKETEFHSLGAGVRTTDSVASGPLILKRIGKASTQIHGMQGNFEEGGRNHVQCYRTACM